MIIIYFGTSKYSAIGEEIIHKTFGISTVVTLPDTFDKKKNPLPNPVKSFALINQIPVLETTKLDEDIIEKIKTLNPDFLIVEDYGLILPQSLLNIPKYAPLNIHHSLLPKYRGPSPAPTAILNGEKITGVSIIFMTNEVDAGDIYAQKEYEIKPTDTTDSLLIELNTLGGHLVVQVINDIVNNTAVRKKQNDREATFTSYMEKSDGFFTVNNPPSVEQLDRMIRAYYPWPGVWTKLQMNKQEKIVKFLPEKKIQVEGKNPMSLKDFYNGYPKLKPTLEKILNLKQ